MNVGANGSSTGPERLAVRVSVEPRDDVSAPWEQLVRRHAESVYRMSYRLTGNRHDAEDLTQDVFVRVFRYLGSYTPGNFGGWLYRVTMNQFRDNVRRTHRLKVDELRESALDRQSLRQPGFEEALVNRALSDDVREALAALSPDFRATVLLFDVDGLTYSEIATVLGIPSGTVGSRIYRGRAQLRAALSHRSAGRRHVALPHVSTRTAA